jgi:hypothetical protein
MTGQTSLAGRLIRRIQPRVVGDFRPPPRPLAEGLWELPRLLKMPGGPNLPSRTTIIRLASGSLVVVTPPPAVGPEEAPQIEALGQVADVVSPNSFHYVYAAGFLAQFPRARFLVSAGLPQRIPALPPCKELAAPPAEWRGEIELAVLGPVKGLSETALFHVASGTLVLTDVAFHLVRFAGTAERLMWRASGVPAGFGPSRTARTLLLGDRSIASAFLRRVAAWPFERILVAHGDVLDRDAQAGFRRAFARWLD